MKKSIITLLKEFAAPLTKTDQGVVNISSQDPTKQQKIDQAKRDKKPYSLYEDEKITEMARIPVNYKLAPDYADKLDALNANKSEKIKPWYNRTVSYLQGVGKSDFTTIAREEFGKTQPKYAEYGRDLIRAGVIIPAGKAGEGEGEESDVVPQFQRMKMDEPAEPKSLDSFKDDDMFIGGGFTDDFETGHLGGDAAEEEPVPDIEPDAPAQQQQTNISDDDYEALMKYLDLRTRIKGVKQDISKIKRSKLTAGDIKDTGRTPEMQKLIARRDDLEKRIGDLVIGNEYLQKRVAKEDNIDSINEVKEKLIERMQKLANINIQLND